MFSLQWHPSWRGPFGATCVVRGCCGSFGIPWFRRLWNPMILMSQADTIAQSQLTILKNWQRKKQIHQNPFNVPNPSPIPIKLHSFPRNIFSDGETMWTHPATFCIGRLSVVSLWGVPTTHTWNLVGLPPGSFVFFGLPGFNRKQPLQRNPDFTNLSAAVVDSKWRRMIIWGYPRPTMPVELFQVFCFPFHKNEESIISLASWVGDTPKWSLWSS